jgi:hypothetical protein
MSKSEHDYKIVGFEGTLSTPETATALITKHTDEGWDVQQIFNATPIDQGPHTYALLRRKLKHV